MAEEEAEEKYFTWAKYRALTPLQKERVAHCYEELCGDNFPEREPNNANLADQEEDISTVLDILGPCEGCVPEHHVDDDVYVPIMKKFRAIVDVAIELIEKEFKEQKIYQPFIFRRIVQPSNEDESKVVVIDWRTGYPFCYYAYGAKPWHHHFDTLAELADEIESVRVEIKKTFLFLNNHHDIKLPVEIPDG